MIMKIGIEFVGWWEVMNEVCMELEGRKRYIVGCVCGGEGFLKGL